MPDPKNDYIYTPDIKGYQNAVWDFLLEHSEITESGIVFIKFHTNNQRNFENRVLSRWKFNYHREDVQAKANFIEKKKETYKENQKKKKEEYREAKKKRLAEFNKSKEPPLIKRIKTFLNKNA